jgi:hypothetical protein
MTQPARKKFGELTITYGFTSFALLNYIKKNGSGEISPNWKHSAF